MLYFLPKAKTVNGETLRRHGIDGLIVDPRGRETSRGPGGGHGLIVASGDVPLEHLTYSEHGQVWKPRFGSDAMLGYQLDSPPTSASLARSRQVRGQSIILADGNAYCVPLLRSFDSDPSGSGPFNYHINLDRVLEQDPETGRMVPGDVTPQYAAVWAQALQIGDCLLEQVTSGGRSTAELEDGVLEDFVAAVLGINYRLDKPELSLLKLLTVELSVQVMQLAIDWPTLQASLKNRLSRLRSSGSDSKSGATQPPKAARSKRTVRP